MGDDRIVLRAALSLLSKQGRDTKNVLSWKVYPEHVAIVVEAGYKYVVPLRDIVALVESEFDETVITFRAYQLALDEGLDPYSIQGTGKDGRITTRDVRSRL